MITLTTEQIKILLDESGGEPEYEIDVGYLPEAWAGPGLYCWTPCRLEDGVIPLFDKDDNGNPVPDEDNLPPGT